MACASEVIGDILLGLQLAASAASKLPGTTGEVAAFVTVADNALQNALAAHKKAGEVVDWSTIQPIDPVV
jgi:hypothetical protein